VDYLSESALAIYRRRRRRRAIFTMLFVTVMLLGSLVYASSYVQGWVGNAAPKALVNASCSGSAPTRALRPGDVTVNVYNTTAHTGLAATAARSLQRQGFRIATTDNDPLGQTLLSAGEIRYGQSGLAGALLVAKRLPGAPLVLDGRTDATVDMVVGAHFRSVKVPPKVAASKKAQPTPHSTPHC
jgi:hypothetical protein